MKRFLLFILLIASAFGVKAFEAERKIIIQDGYFYYTSIHPENQLVTLHKGNFSQLLYQSDLTPLPIGRNYEDPQIPLSWDLRGEVFMGNNFLRHPLNDWAESIKKMSLTDIKNIKTTEDPVFDLIMNGVENHMWVLNQPFTALRIEATHFENFHFDMVMDEAQHLYYLISNLGKSQLWKYNNTEWQLLSQFNNEIQTPFSIITYHNEILVFQPQMITILNKQGKTINNIEMAAKIDNPLIIEDRDQDIIYYLDSKELTDNIPFKKVLKQNSFFKYSQK